MKSITHPPQEQIKRGLRAARQDNVGTATFSILALLGAVLLITSPARAANILYNGNFNLPASGAVPTGWTATNWNNSGGSSWANHQNNTGVTYDGSYYIVVGNNWYEGYGRFSQTLSAAPGIGYTLTVLSGADAWWLPKGTMSMIFLDSSTNTLSTATRNTVDPAVYGPNYDIAHPWASYSLTTNAPAGTTQLRVEFASNNGPGVGGSIWFENADLEPSVAYPAIANVSPDGTILMQVTNKLSFAATSGAAITGIQVILNGVDISSNLVVTGSSTSKSVTYSGLKTNQAYVGTITVIDANSLSASAPLRFDTFNPVFLWEAEDFDYTNGLYLNNPTLSSTPAPGSYFGVVGNARR